MGGKHEKPHTLVCLWKHVTSTDAAAVYFQALECRLPWLETYTLNFLVSF